MRNSRSITYMTVAAGVSLLITETFALPILASLGLGLSIWAGMVLTAIVLDAVFVAFFTSGLMG